MRIHCFGQKRVQKFDQCQMKEGQHASIYVSDYKTAGEIVRVAYTLCFGAYVRFNTVKRFKLCQGCQVLLPVTSPTMPCSTQAAGSFAETVVVSATDGGERLTLHIIYQSESDSVTLCTQLDRTTCTSVCLLLIGNSRERAYVSMRDELFHSLLCAFIHSTPTGFFFNL